MCCVMPPASDVGHLGLADGVEQRGLAVVDVAHDGDHRSAVAQVGLIVDELVDLVLLFLGVLDLDLALELLGQDDDGVVGQRLRDGDHLAQLDHGLDDLGRAHLQRFGEVLDGGAARHRHRALGSGRRLALDRRPCRRRPSARRDGRLRTLAALAAGLRVDDDPPTGRLVVATPNAEGAATPVGLRPAAGFLGVPAAGAAAGFAARGRSSCRARGAGTAGRRPGAGRSPGRAGRLSSGRRGVPRVPRARTAGTLRRLPRDAVPRRSVPRAVQPRCSGVASAAGLGCDDGRLFTFAVHRSRRLDPLAQRDSGSDHRGHIVQARFRPRGLGPLGPGLRAEAAAGRGGRAPSAAPGRGAAPSAARGCEPSVVARLVGRGLQRSGHGSATDGADGSAPSAFDGRRRLGGTRLGRGLGRLRRRSLSDGRGLGLLRGSGFRSRGAFRSRRCRR